MPNDCVMCGKTRFNFGDYDENEMGACENGFECSVCGCVVEDCEGYCVKGEWNRCPKCGRIVVDD